MIVFIFLFGALIYWFAFIKPAKDSIQKRIDTRDKFRNYINAMQSKNATKYIIEEDKAAYYVFENEYLNLGMTHKKVDIIQHLYFLDIENEVGGLKSYKFSLQLIFLGVKWGIMHNSIKITDKSLVSPEYFSPERILEIYFKLLQGFKNDPKYEEYRIKAIEYKVKLLRN